MLRLLSGSANIKKSAMGGVRTVAEILNFMGSANETSVIDSVREYDPDLAQKILDEMFVFENLLDLDDRSIQLLLREIQSDSLILAMKGASENLREKIFKNMSQRAAEMLREDLEAKGPVRISEVETEQKEILKIVRRLADEGQIVPRRQGRRRDDLAVEGPPNCHDRRLHPERKADRLRALGAGRLRRAGDATGPRTGAGTAAPGRGAAAPGSRAGRDHSLPPRRKRSSASTPRPHEAGYNAGYEEGAARAKAEAERLDNLIHSLAQSLQVLDQDHRRPVAGTGPGNRTPGHPQAPSRSNRNCCCRWSGKPWPP